MKKVLHFSGGKDSLACLFLLRDEWDELLVMWCNTGAAYPETVSFMEKIKGMVPHFIEVNGNQPGYVKANGHPADVVPIRLTRVGHMVHGTSGPMICDYMSCCASNIWKPLADATMALGAEIVYRGQRQDDVKKSPIKSGHTECGVTYIFPIEDWTKQQVFDYLGDVAPEYYKTELSSRDCWNCTAYLDDNAERIKNLPIDKRQYVVGIIKDMRAVIAQEQMNFDEVLSGS